MAWVEGDMPPYFFPGLFRFRQKHIDALRNGCAYYLALFCGPTRLCAAVAGGGVPRVRGVRLLHVCRFVCFFEMKPS